MKRKVPIISFLLCAFACLIGMVSNSISWFIEKAIIEEQSGLVGESQGAYFARGVGSSSEPFIINRPIHLYNLAWLQYIGYFNNSNAPYYFALDPDDNQKVLDMDGWVLPPIGTSLYPFIGNFNGNGETIQNLTIDNEISADHIEKTPTFISASSVNDKKILKTFQKDQSGSVSAGTYLNSTVDVVGFFGFLGTYSGMESVNADYSSANQVNDVALDEMLVTSSSASSLGGLGVGYMNAPVSGMGISDSTLSFASGAEATSITSNLSDFSTVGFATATYLSSVSSYRTSAVVPDRTTSSGTGNEGGHERDWGGSIDFKEIFNRLDNVYETRAKPYWRGVYSESITNVIFNSSIGGNIHEDSNSGTINSQSYYDGATSANPVSFDSNLLVFDSTHDKTNSYNALEGKVAFHEMGSVTTGYDYQYLFGGKEGFSQFKKSQTANNTIAYKEDSFLIMGGSPEKEIRQVTDTHSSYNISVYNYGLNASNTTTITATRNSATTKWCITDDQLRDVSITSANNSLVFTVIDNNIYYITGVLNNYWNLNNPIYLTSDRSAALRFTYDGKRLRPIIDGNQRYLYQSGNSIYVSTDSDSFQYQTSGNITITHEEVYNTGVSFLNTNGVSIQQGSDESEATYWTYSQREADASRIYTTINGVNYYLNATTTGFNVSASPSTIWAKSSAGVLSAEIESATFYLNWDEESGFYMSNEADASVTLRAKGYQAYTLYYRTNNTNYYFNATTNAVSSSTTNSGVAIAFSNGINQPGFMFFVSGGTPYYIYAASSTALGVTTNVQQASIWTVSGEASGTIYTKYNNTIRYLYNNNNSWSLNANSRTIVFSVSDSINAEIYELMAYDETSTSSINNGVNVPETIVPLVTSGVTSYTATEKNYGYIVSGSNSLSEEDLMAQASIADSGYGDIRIAKYPIGNIYNSVTGGSSNDARKTKDSTYCNGKNLGIIGRSYKSNGYVHITDDFDSGNNGVSLPSTKMNYADMGLTKYKDSRGITNHTTQDSGLVKLLKEQTGVYGLHYVKGLVSPTNTCVAEKVIIDNEEISNFEMPRDAIDFTLHDSGFVNFFAHTGYVNSGGPTNNSFFDLFEIERETTDDKSSSTISSIKKIKTIYGKLDGGFIDLSVPYIYLYDDNTISDSNYANVSSLTGAGYSPVFQMSWITDYSTGSELTNAWKNYSIYYFEIPINAGEYALGSVKNGEGAYLMYLDLGGNAMRYDFSNFTEYMKIIESSYQYPVGVAIIQNSVSGGSAVKDDVNGANSVGIAILSAETVSFQKEGNIVSCDYQADASEVNFVGVNLVMKKSGQDPPIIAEGSVTKTTEYFRLTTVAYNITLKRYEVTELTKTVVTPSTGSATTSYSGKTSLDAGTTWTNMSVADATSAINALNEGAGIADVSENVVMISFVSEVQYNEGETLDPVTIEFLLTYEEIVSQQVTEKYQNATGYSFTITNPSTSNDLTVTVINVLKNQDGSVVYVLSVNKITITVVGQTVTVKPPAPPTP